jgi:hypothetical protein
MPVVDAINRIAALRELNVSQAVIEQSSGNLIHPLFEFRCQPPFYPYHGAAAPAGLEIVPIWESGDAITAICRPPSRPMFIRFDIELVDAYEEIASTEQGMLANLFVGLIEDNDELDLDGFTDAALAIGFRYLERVFSQYVRFERGTAAAHFAFLRHITDQIDELGG